MSALKISMDEFSGLYSEYKLRFTLIANSFIQDWERSEDIVSDSFLYFLEHHDTIDVGTTPQAYILGIVRNKCLMELRSRLSQEKAYGKIQKVLMEASMEELKSDSLMHSLFCSEVREIFRRELEKMPELAAKVFLSSRMEEKTYSEIAEKYGISVHKVAREIQTALAILRKSLKDYLPFITFITFTGL